MNAARQVQRIAAGTSSTPALLVCDTLLLPSPPPNPKAKAPASSPERGTQAKAGQS